MSDFDDFDLSEFDTDDDEDILDSYDGDDDDDDNDDSSPELSGEEINRRVGAYQKLTKQNMRKAVKAKQFKKNERVEAIRWLGESGNPEAISALLKVYKKDKTPGMKEVAAYALGQFRAHKQDEDDPELGDTAVQRIDDIILYDKIGKRANPTPLIIVEVVLVIFAILLFGFGGLKSGQNAAVRQTQYYIETEVAPTWTPDVEDAVRNDLEAYYANLNADAHFYQQQLAAASRGDIVNCDLSLLANAANYNLSSNWENDERFIAIVSELNNVRTEMEAVRSAYADSCNQNRALPRQDGLDLGGVIINIQRTSMPPAREALSSAGIVIVEQVFATTTPIPTSTPDPAIPTATEDLTALSNSIIDLERIIDDMTFQGPTPKIIFNWQQVVDNGEIYRSGCNQPEPIIPPDYAIPNDLLGTSPLLDSAVNNLNIGLQSTRLSVTAFYEACTTGIVPETATGSLAQAQLAETAFTTASNDLNSLQGR